MTDESKALLDRRFNIAREIQDHFCRSEKIGFSFNGQHKDTEVKSVRNLLSRFKIQGKYPQKSQRTPPATQYTDKVDITVVIPAFGPSPSLEKCIESLNESRGVFLHVTVVDNGADEQTIAQVKEFSCVENVISNSGNRGFGGACDQGIQATHTEFVVLLNSDAFVEPSTLRIIVDELVSNSSVGICAATCLNGDGSIQEAGRVLNSDAHSFGILENSLQDDLETSRTASVPYASFVCVAMRTSTYLSLGGFDPIFTPAYSEDADLCLRMHESGLTTIVSHDARVRHELGESSDLLPGLEELKERNRSTLREKHESYFLSLPKIDEPGYYPHEMFMARNSQQSSCSFCLFDKIPTIEEISSLLSIEPNGFLNNSILIAVTNQELDVDGLRISDERWKLVEIFDPSRLAFHHWLRERICSFENIYVISDFQNNKPGDMILLLEITQPNAQWHFIEMNK